MSKNLNIEIVLIDTKFKDPIQVVEDPIQVVEDLEDVEE